MFTRFLAVMATVLLTYSVASAEMYQWVDEKGVVTLKDTPPPKTKKARKLKTYSDDDFAAAPISSPSQPAPKASSSSLPTRPATPPPGPSKFAGTVEVYVTSWCGYCKKAQQYLTEKGVPFVAYDIEKDGAARKRHQELGGRGVPLVVIGSNKISGFSPQSMDYYLNNSR